MEIITSFKGSLEDLEKYESIIVAPQEFAVANDYNLTNHQIENLVRLGNENNIKVYVLCNQMIYDEDIEALENHLKWIRSLNVTGVYFADMAVFVLAKKLAMLDKMIYGPGMTIVNSEDVKAYLDMGIQAVELANELTLDEKIAIAKSNPDQVGIVISGYLLMSYSKRKVLSNYFEYINKDMKLEKNYNLSLVERTRSGKMPIYEDANGAYIYSEYVFHSFNYLNELLAAPFKYFRIDGIFMDTTMIEDLLNAYTANILGRSDDFLVFLANKYPNYVFNDTFYYTETSEVK